MLTLPEIHEPIPTNPERWTPGQQWPSLQRDEVHLWRALLDDPRLLALAPHTLSLGEMIRAERCTDARERDRFIALRAFLRSVLSRYLRIAPADLEMDEDGSVPSTLRITHSQSDGLALLAVSLAREVGIEVERVREDLPFDEMAAHFFDPAQQWGLRITFSREEKAWKFFDFWTTSEACSKATPMHSAHSIDRLALHRLSPAEGFLAALAVEGDDSRLALWDWC